jgi:hypothetical protein
MGLIALNPVAKAAEVVDVLPLTDRIVVVHFNEGHVNHHGKGQVNNDDSVVISPLDVVNAAKATSYGISSSDDPNFTTARTPARVGRKSKGTDFSWFTDRWVGDHFENDRPDHTKEHWLYLTLSTPLVSGKTYTVSTGSLATNGSSFPFRFDETQLRSEAVHVNQVGYVTDASAKFGYVYHWMGDQGGLDLAGYVGRKFWVIDAKSGQKVLEGKLALRAKASQVETGQINDTPGGNFQGADVYECDFSALRTTGRYRLAVEGVGCSFPFAVGADVYRGLFQSVTRALYSNRSGIALTAPYTTFVRPAPHNPLVTPGFKGKLKYTALRFMDWGSEGGDKTKLEQAIKGDLDVSGWYQDAGDWDSYDTHLRIAFELMLAYEIAPNNFSDGELKIPESGNGIPDILDEAMWLPRFCYRLRKELLTKKYGTGGIGLRICGDAFGSDAGPNGVLRGSWEDVDRTWVASGEDPVSTFRYAGAAAQIAYLLRQQRLTDPAGIDWAKEARESYSWALKNTLASDESAVKGHRLYAAAALFRLTAASEYESQLAKDTDGILATSVVDSALFPGVALYSLGEASNSTMRDRLRGAVLATADQNGIGSANKRALRWGGDFFFPMLVGQQTTPLVPELAVAWKLTAKSDPAKSQTYRSVMLTTADFFSGTNALNTTWVTGVGSRSPKQIFHLDAWANGQGKFQPGLIPYGPWRRDKSYGAGPWDLAWAYKTVYPEISKWPGSEQWFDNRNSPLASEFTVHQNLAPATAFYGILCAPATKKGR